MELPASPSVRSVLAAMLFTGHVATAATLYVWQESPHPAPPYATWATAATNIQAALDASTNGDEIIVTNGVYETGAREVRGSSNRVAVVKPVTVRSVNGPEMTVIRGDYGYPGARCVYLSGGAVLTGFTLTRGGLAFEGGGVWCESPTAVVSNCVLVSNMAAYGGGAYGGTLNNCTLSGNLAIVGSGGGAYGSSLNNCTLSGNEAYETFEGGDGFGGGAYGGTLNNCTLAGNWADSGGGGVAFAILNNCCVYYNGASLGGNNYDNSTLNFCCTTSLPTNGIGNITNEPAFVDPAGGNYRLRPESRCIDAGTNLSAIITNDLDGNARPLDGNQDGSAAFDMGAYEYVFPPCIGEAARITSYELSSGGHMQVAFRGTPNAVHTVEMFNFSDGTVAKANLTADAQGDFLFTDPQPATRPILLYKAWPQPPPGYCPDGAEARPIWNHGCITAYACAIPASGECVRNSLQSCVKDSDCRSGGCGGELCYNPHLGPRGTSCDCTQPVGVTCGCINGQCMWFYTVTVEQAAGARKMPSP